MISSASGLQPRWGWASTLAFLTFSVLVLSSYGTTVLLAISPDGTEVLLDTGTWVQTDWSGGSGQLSWIDGDPSRYASGDGVDAREGGLLGLGFTLPYTSAGDLDQDGYPDIVFANWLDQYPPQHHGVDSYVYWGGPDGFSNDRRIGLPTRGAVGVSVADLNNDGTLDLVFSNQRSGFYSNPSYAIDSYIYWGGDGGYSANRRTGLPTLGSMSNSIADLNEDGYLDIVFANSTDGATVDVDSYIYWGGPAGYSPANRTDLPVRRGVGVSAIDVNQDGTLDLIFSNTTDGAFSDIDSYIYWGSPDGYDPAHRTGLPTIGSYDNTAADLNGDGHLDLVFSNRYRSMYGMCCDFDVPSYIYWGSAEGYSVTARSDLPTVGAVGLSVADLDQDSYLDIVFSNGSDRYSYIYWGDPTAAYGPDQRTDLRVHESLANSVADLNGDGNLDLVFSGDWNGLVFWGDGSRVFSSQRRTVLSTVTSLGNAVAGARLATAGSSMGTVYTRPITDGTTMSAALMVPRIYAATGYLESSIYDARSQARWLTMSWEAQAPTGTGVSVFLSASDDGAMWSSWQRVADVESAEADQVDLVGLMQSSRYLRYRVLLTSSADHQEAPQLKRVTVDYRLLAGTVTPTSSRIAEGTSTPTSSVSPTASPSIMPTESPTPSRTGTATEVPTATSTRRNEQRMYLPLVYWAG